MIRRKQKNIDRGACSCYAEVNVESPPPSRMALREAASYDGTQSVLVSLENFEGAFILC